jgi:FMN-dependent NADH-azoreductase
MARLLYIESSPRKDRSASINIARSFIEEYRTNHPDDSITVLDLWKTDLPSFDGDTINAKYAILHGEDHSESQKNAWSSVENIISDFTSADKYLISLPMWNFGIPYVLKHYIDILVQPSYTFSFSPDSGYSGLITGKPAAIVYARGGAYDTGSDAANLDFQKSYMELVLGFIGITDIKSIIAEPMLMASPEDKAMLIQQAKDTAKKIALTF